MKHKSKKPKFFFGSFLGLTLAAMLTQNVTAQNANPDSVQQWKALNEEQAKGDAVQQKEADRLFQEERTRREGERLNKLRKVLDQNQALLEQPRQLLNHLFQLPATLTLSVEHRALAEASLQAQRERALAAWPTWQQEALIAMADKTGDTKADAEQVVLHLSQRVLNETALWFADATAQTSDALWLQALKSPGLCQAVTQSTPAAYIAALIEALPAEQRAAAWQGEAERLARWGQPTREVLAPPQRTLEDSLQLVLSPAGDAKAQARLPEAQREALRSPNWRYASQSPSQRCELLRWWSQEQVRTKQLTALQAYHAFRTALVVRAGDYLLTDLARSGPQALGPGGFPLVARQLGLAGKVVVEQDIDASGKVLSAFIQRRELQVAALRQAPALALEHELDQVSLERAAAGPLVAPEPATLRQGVATRRVGIEWIIK